MEAIHKINMIVKNILFYIYASFVGLFIFILSPIVNIRIGKLISSRIGHYVLNTELYICEKSNNINTPKGNYIDLWFEGNVSNIQISKMWRRELTLLPKLFLFPVYTLFSKHKYFHKFLIKENTCHDRDVLGLLQNSMPNLVFNCDELKKGYSYLEKYGVKKDDKYICLFVRDSAYLNTVYPNNNWSYHDYRDVNVSNYELACEYLSNTGYKVFRMGAVVSNPISFASENIIDYATNGDRNPFLDVFLGAHCYFAISTSSGWDAIPLAFRRPVLFTNFAPIGYLQTWVKNSMFTHKKMIDDEGNLLTISEIFNRGFGGCLNGHDLAQNNIHFVENSPAELRGAVSDMLNYIQSGSSDLTYLESSFWDMFKNGVDTNGLNHLHGDICLRCSTSFLKSNASWMK